MMVFHPDEKYLKIQEQYFKSIKELQAGNPGLFNLQVEVCEKRLKGMGYKFVEQENNTYKLERIKK